MRDRVDEILRDEVFGATGGFDRAAGIMNSIATYIEHAVKIAQLRGLAIETHAPSVILRRESASATLRFLPDHIFLERLEVNADQRHKQYGDVLLDDIIAIADQTKLRIDLIAESPLIYDGFPSKWQTTLEAWYRRHGFTCVRETLMSRDYATHSPQTT